MIKESFAAKCFAAGMGIGAVLGGVAAYGDYRGAENRNGEIATEFLDSQEYLQGFIDKRYISVTTELDSTEQWLGQGCLRLIERGYGELDSLAEIQEASECTVSSEVRKTAAPLLEDLRDEHEILQYYSSTDGRMPILERVAEDAREAIADSQDTGYFEMFGSEDTEIIAVATDNQGEIVELHSDKPHRAMLIIALSGLVVGGIAGFVGDKYRHRVNARQLRAEQKRISDENEQARIDSMVISETYDMDMVDSSEFWNRMDR